ncbi:MAG: ferrochelatase [Planctomycetota bacterium]|nr:ferrochelatase [Planctomycetota bacterium]
MNITSTNASTDPASPRVPIGVLYVNLGTPASPAVADVRRFLRQFLSDRMVVDVSRVVWWPLLNFVILPLRGPKSAHAYSSIWTSEGSPLMVISKRQAALLQRDLGANYTVELAMRYGEPSIERGLNALRSRGVERVIVLTAFPQFSKTTVGTVKVEVQRALTAARSPLKPTFVDSWHEAPAYIDALAERCREAEGAEPIAHWVWSFHGLPKRYVRMGDIYREHCERTAELLAARLGLAPERWSIAFQSRFGREPWLQPYVDVLVPELAKTYPRVGVAMPGFTADCLETLEEIAIRLRETFEAGGGRELVVAACVNDSETLVRALGNTVRDAARVIRAPDPLARVGQRPT